MKLFDSSIRLLPLENSHIPQLLFWFHSGEYQQFFGNSKIITFDSLSSLTADKKQNIFVITKFDDFSKILGCVCITKINERSRSFYVACLVDKNHHRQKIASSAIIILINYAMNSLNLYKAIAESSATNVASIKAMENLGFKHEGTLIHEEYVDGTFVDVERFCFLKGAFNKLYKKGNK